MQKVLEFNLNVFSECDFYVECAVAAKERYRPKFEEQ